MKASYPQVKSISTVRGIFRMFFGHLAIVVFFEQPKTHGPIHKLTIFENWSSYSLQRGTK
jgi:hypothetical protein